MASKIKFGIYPNPLPDAGGKTTYQVRHIPEGTMNEKEFLAPLKPHFTDPNDITALDVEVQGVSFTPDPSLATTPLENN